MHKDDVSSESGPPWQSYCLEDKVEPALTSMIRSVVNCGTSWRLIKGSNPPTDYTDLGINSTTPYSAETQITYYDYTLR